jgi:hypothetical protein
MQSPTESIEGAHACIAARLAKSESKYTGCYNRPSGSRCKGCISRSVNASLWHVLLELTTPIRFYPGQYVEVEAPRPRGTLISLEARLRESELPVT